MASKFHDINGWLFAGADMHKGVFLPTLADMWFMEANVLHPFWMGKNGALDKSIGSASPRATASRLGAR